jgi:hypothetical protein
LARKRVYFHEINGHSSATVMGFSPFQRASDFLSTV